MRRLRGLDGSIGSLSSLGLVASLLALACSKHQPTAPPPATEADARMCVGAGETVGTSKETPPEVTCSGGKQHVECYGEWSAHCGPDDKLVKLTNCRAHNQVCSMHDCTSAGDCNGCVACRPASVLCGDDGQRMICRDDGSGYDPADPCDEASGQRCSIATGQCEDLCAAAEAEKSYIGCDYWAVATSNSELAFEGTDSDGLCQPFTFAVVVANAEGVPATVTVQGAGAFKRQVTVAPNESVPIELPCSPDLMGINSKRGDPRYAMRTKTAALHITSDTPVTVFQFNPFEYQSTDSMGDTIYSYTNDASILLPTTSLTGDYVAMSQPTRLEQFTPFDASVDAPPVSAPGFVTIIGVDPTPTMIDVTSSAYTLPSKDGSIQALAPGDHFTTELEQGEVLQLLSATPDGCDGEPTDTITRNVNGMAVKGTFTYCKVGKDYDLTGTHISSSGRVEVISGHDCVFLPYNRWACDHIEETMFPTQSWGRDVSVGITETVACQPTIPNIVRVLSSADGNSIAFGPAKVHAAVTLDKDQFIEFEATDDFHVSASHAVQVAQYMLGQEYHGNNSTSPFAKGDPSLSLAVPDEQFRKNYPFLIPETYTDNYVNIIAREHQLVLLDSRVVSGFLPVGNPKTSKTVIARVPITPGEHFAQSQNPFGVTIYGYAPFTSYEVPGGLDLQPIGPPLL